jgi:hypothetical protein
MFVKQRKASTDPRLRSLIQKAVRRGHSSVVESTARKLHAIRDVVWLRSRAAVITFEECWPAAQHLSIGAQFESRLAAFLMVSSAEKHKDAAGLGALAYAYGEGDQTIVDFVPDRRALRTVAEGLKRPAAFFEWAAANSASAEATRVIDAARQYLPAATWGWDKACLIAGAFLASTAGVPEFRAASNLDSPFPYWVALDKHTPEGKLALRAVAKERCLPYRHVIWSSFYFESAKANALAESPWWNAEQTWRLTRAGLTSNAARDLWNGLRLLVAARLESQAEELQRAIETQRPLTNQLV